MPVTGDIREDWEEQSQQEIHNLKDNLLRLCGDCDSDWMCSFR